MAGVMPEKRKRIIFITLSVLGVMLILFFGLRAFRAFKKFGTPPPLRFAEELQTDINEIEDWMTLPYISYNYGVPPDIFFKALNIEPKENHKKSLKQLNDEYYPEQDGYVLDTVRDLVRAHRSPPTPVPPNTLIPPLTPIPPNDASP